MEGLLVVELFAHMLENGGNNNDEVEGSNDQGFNSPKDNSYDIHSSDDGLTSLHVLYMGIGAQR